MVLHVCWLLEKPVLKSFCYDGTSSLAKTLTSLSRCFYFPLKTYTHGTTSRFPTADPRVAVYLTGHLTAALLEKRRANSVPRYVTNDGG